MWYIHLFFSVPFIVTSLGFWYLDLYTKFISYRYKDQDRNHLVKIYKNIIPLVTFNLLILHPFLTFLTSYFVTINTDYDSFDALQCLSTILFCIVVYDVIFYLVHRLFHKKFIFDQIHYKHHELKTTVGVGGIFTHPIEYAVCNFSPGFIGLYLIGTHHLYTICILSIAAGAGAAMTHSGYYGTHIKHHWSRNCYYSVYGLMDYLLNTGEEKTTR